MLLLPRLPAALLLFTTTTTTTPRPPSSIPRATHHHHHHHHHHRHSILHMSASPSPPPPAIRVQGAGSPDVNGLYARQDPQRVPAGFQRTCEKMRWPPQATVRACV